MLARQLATALHQMLICLEALITTFQQMRNTVVRLQRYYLELVALLDYCQPFKPKMNGSVPCSDFDNK